MRKKKTNNKVVHYVQLKTHRRFANPTNFYAHLNSLHAKIQPNFYTIQSILNNRWTQIQRPLVIRQFEKQHRDEIRTIFQHQVEHFDEFYRLIFVLI